MMGDKTMANIQNQKISEEYFAIAEDMQDEFGDALVFDGVITMFFVPCNSCGEVVYIAFDSCPYCGDILFAC
jgi:predicted nucleic acid binding AN1-type Zn finger protein